jgi:cytoskeletal protein RodZ
MGFFVVLIIVLAIAWFFAQLQKQREAAPETTPAPALEEASAVEVVPNTKRTPTPLPPSDHGTTYYLDAEGNILDVVRF